MTDLQLRDVPQGVLLPVRVQARAKHAGVVGIYAGALKIAVTTAPEKGRANRAVHAILAELLQIAPQRLRLVRGATSCAKQFLVVGLCAAEVLQRLGLHGPS
ncbi:MAG: hypothetical protein C4297_09610 [Gemmataceae bacterium]